MLFLAHHTAELAAKAALLAGGVAFEARHGLAELWSEISISGLSEAFEISEAHWCQGFASFVADVAGNSIRARYAKPSPGRIALDEVWCCVDATALFEATERFAIQCVAIAQTAEETGAQE